MRLGLTGACTRARRICSASGIILILLIHPGLFGRGVGEGAYCSETHNHSPSPDYGLAGIQRTAPTKLAFAKGKEKDANVLISDKALPEGAHVQMILTIKTTPDAKAVTERFELHLH